MQNAVTREWLPRAVLIVGLVTGLRIVLLALNRTDLFVDESQYWFWGQGLDFGYYSKPPLIAWIIRASVEIGGSDSQFWVRLPGPLCHAAVALILGAIASRRFGALAAVWTAALWITLPMVTVGSTLASTDTVMMPWLALALWAWLGSMDRGGDLRWALGAGLALGVGFLGKYAAVYYLICAGLVILAGPWRRPAAIGMALLGFVVAISPNLIWNLGNGFATVEHTLDNADWVRDPGDRAALNPAGLGEFLASQFVVFGPVLFGALLWRAVTERDTGQRILLAFSLPILLLVAVQALLSQAYANWAATAYLAGLLLVVPWLLTQHRAWLWGTITLHGGFALFIPLATAFGTGWTGGPQDRLLLARYLGRAEMSETLLTLAQDQGLALVADDRDILADLFHQGRGADVAVYARPVQGRPPNHYVQTQSLPRSVTGPILLVTKHSRPPRACSEVVPVATLAPASGAYRDRPQGVYHLPAECLQP